MPTTNHAWTGNTLARSESVNDLANCDCRSESQQATGILSSSSVGKFDGTGRLFNFFGVKEHVRLGLLALLLLLLIVYFSEALGRSQLYKAQPLSDSRSHIV